MATYWAQEYQNIVQAHQVLATLPKVARRTPPPRASDYGSVQTLIAYNYMIMAEAHDTLGIAIRGRPLPPVRRGRCVKTPGVHRGAPRLGQRELQRRWRDPDPGRPAQGFAALSTAGPSTAAGTFGPLTARSRPKANLELAYAIARAKGQHVPHTHDSGHAGRGRVDQCASGADRLGDVQPGRSSAPDPSGGFTPGQFVVTHDFSATSGDLVNPINGEIGTLAQLNDFVVAVDTVNDLRWAAKFKKNPNTVQQQLYNAVASKYIPSMYPSPASPIPIVREVQLVLWHAQILMGMGTANYAAALADVNLVRDDSVGRGSRRIPGAMRAPM